MDQQRNIQVYVGKGPDATEGTTEQAAMNAAGVGQTTVAATGDAVATEGSDATSGRAEAQAETTVQQVNRQVAR